MNNNNDDDNNNNNNNNNDQGMNCIYLRNIWGQSL